jgi:hypothetical protein
MLFYGVKTHRFSCDSGVGLGSTTILIETFDDHNNNELRKCFHGTQILSGKEYTRLPCSDQLGLHLVGANLHS